jgi:hypothetical protein
VSGSWRQATGDEGWLRDRLASIKDSKITTGLVFDEDGEAHKFVSGRDDDAEIALKVGRDAGAFPQAGRPNVVDHVEVKAAAAMRRGDVRHGLLVINKSSGPCAPDEALPYTCVNLVPKLLAPGAEFAGVLGGRQRAAKVTPVRRGGLMISSVRDAVSRSDLAHAATHDLVASGVFQFSGATYSVQFTSESGLLECLDVMMSRPRKPETPRLYLRARGYLPDRPEWPPSNLRFDFDAEHGVAAVVCLAVDRHGEMHAWMTRGDAARHDVVLTHDSWNPEDRRFPAESFITIAELRELVVRWAFGDVLPPPTTHWAEQPADEVGWF